MITNILFDDGRQYLINPADREAIERKVLASYPYPMAVSYYNLCNAVRSGNKPLLLNVFNYDITTTFFQFLSLILASDYITGNYPRSYRLFQLVENMTYRPGPGKWLEFMREYHNYLKNEELPPSSFPEIVEFIRKYEINRKYLKFRIEENHGSVPCKRFGLLELLVSLRNNSAHTRGYDETQMDILAEKAADIAAFIFSELDFLSRYNLKLAERDNDSDSLILAGIDLPDLTKTPEKYIFFLTNKEKSTRLFPLLISDQPVKNREKDIFLLESLDNKRVFYAANRMVSEKRHGTDPVTTEVLSALKSIEVQPESLSSINISWEQLKTRMDLFSGGVLSEYQINGKYRDSVYVLPAGYNDILNEFYSSEKRCILLADHQGSGKSALCAHIVDDILKKNDPDATGLLIDARTLDELGKVPGIIEEYIRRSMKIEGDIPELFNRLGRDHPQTYITIVIDNLNEYYLTNTHQSFVIDQLIDFVFRLSTVQNIKVIAAARPDFYINGFKEYKAVFETKIETVTLIKNHKNFVLLPPLTVAEKGKLWEKYTTELIGFSPKTSWDELNIAVRENCKTPLVMLFLLRKYDNKEIPDRLTLREIKREYVSHLLENKDHKRILFGLIKLMYKEGRPFLLSENFSDELMKTVADTTKDPDTSKPYNHAYSQLVDSQIIREERVKKGNLAGRKISVSNEMVLDLINTDYKNEGKKINRRLIPLLSLLIATTVIVLVTVFFLVMGKPFINESKDSFNDIINHHHLFDDIRADENFVGKIISLFDKGTHLKAIATPAMLSVSLLTMIFLLIYNGGSYLPDFFNLKKKQSQYSFYEILHFNNISIQNSRHLMKFSLWIMLGMVILVTAIMSKTVFSHEAGWEMPSAIVLAAVSLLLITGKLGLLFYNSFISERSFLEYSGITWLRSLGNSILKGTAMVYLILITLYITPGLYEQSHELTSLYYGKRFGKLINDYFPEYNDPRMAKFNELIGESSLSITHPFAGFFSDMSEYAMTGHVGKLTVSDSEFQEVWRDTEWIDDIKIHVLLFPVYMMTLGILTFMLPLIIAKKSYT